MLKEKNRLNGESHCGQSRTKLLNYLKGEKMYLKELPTDAKQIENHLNWCTPNGDFYGIETRKVPNRWKKDKLTPVKHYGEYFKLTPYINKKNGYAYITLKFIKENGYEKRTYRAHKKIAETFLPNEKNYPIVGHKNNIKIDNRIANLYWTTYAENTQKAVMDELLINKKGYEDSQSKPVIMYDTKTNQELARFGSCREAAEMTGRSLTTICRQAKYKRPVRKDVYFRYQD